MHVQNQQPWPPHKKLKLVGDDDVEWMNTVEKKQCDKTLKELLIRLDKRVENIERQQTSINKKLDKLVDLMRSSDSRLKADVKVEEEDNFVVS